MAHVSKTAVSRLLAEKTIEEEQGTKKAISRDDFKKLKELEEQRKLGNAPAAVDEEGKDINPHIPQYISDAPWYLDPKGPTLKHQRPQEEKIKQYTGIDQWYRKGVDLGSVATKFRKGACENCGAMTHKKRDCVERPRKVGAKFTSTNFAPDEFVQPNLSLSFDGKRDRWNGYDSTAHREVIEEYQKLEEVKKDIKKERLLKAGFENAAEEDDGMPSSDEDEDKYVDKMDMPGTKVDAAERYTVRNLRIREDTAKYLRNLDLGSAYYDPKTRAMRQNPYEGTGRKEDEVDYAGDNFVRISGDTVNHAQSQMFAWDAGRKGLEVHALAEPTKLELMKKEYVQKKEKLEDVAKNKIMEKYGGQEYLEAPPRELIFAQSEHYCEYTKAGNLIRGEEAAVVRSRYTEDVYPNNHTSVWGSYWNSGRWGYKCCHSFLKNSYCVGAAGKDHKEGSSAIKALAEKAAADRRDRGSSPSSTGQKDSGDEDDEDDEKVGKGRKKSRKKDKKKKKRQEKAKSKGDKEGGDFEAQVASAMKKLDQDEKSADKMMDDRKRGYNSMVSMESHKAPTEAEMEAYYRKRQRTEDPMAKYI